MNKLKLLIGLFLLLIGLTFAYFMYMLTNLLSFLRSI
jgi:hypothetical protein